MNSLPLLLLLPIITLSLFLPSTTPLGFPCKPPSPTATCQSLAGYIPPNATTLSSLQSLFNLTSLPSLLGANNLPLSTPSSFSVAANSTILIPFPCSCSNGTGISDHTPFYTVKPTDTAGLDAIARYTFDQFVSYEDISKVNGLKDADVINAGQRLWIPLPCSCDDVDGKEVVHLGHVVKKGSSVGEIAGEFGTTEEVILRLNGIADPKMLQAGQILDVPLKACSSSIKSTSLDQNLRLSNGTYAVTAENCMQCSCSSSSNYQLSCKPTPGLNKSQCPVSKCSNGLSIGNSTAADGCDTMTCEYQGYTNSTGLKILSGLVKHSTCSNGPAPQPAANSPPSGSSAGRLRMQEYRVELLFLLQIAFLWFGFLA